MLTSLSLSVSLCLSLCFSPLSVYQSLLSPPLCPSVSLPLFISLSPLSPPSLLYLSHSSIFLFPTLSLSLSFFYIKIYFRMPDPDKYTEKVWHRFLSLSVSPMAPCRSSHFDQKCQAAPSCFSVTEDFRPFSL